MKTGYFVTLMCIFLWTGFICAISFMEAWLKFKAPGVTISIGLGIGKLVFGALNKVEWLFAVVIFVMLLSITESTPATGKFLFATIIVILSIQTFWLLKALDIRAEAYINGLTVSPSSYLHWYFIIGELAKVTLLTWFGITVFKSVIR